MAISAVARDHGLVWFVLWFLGSCCLPVYVFLQSSRVDRHEVHFGLNLYAVSALFLYTKEIFLPWDVCACVRPAHHRHRGLQAVVHIAYSGTGSLLTYLDYSRCHFLGWWACCLCMYCCFGVSGELVVYVG